LNGIPIGLDIISTR